MEEKDAWELFKAEHELNHQLQMKLDIANGRLAILVRFLKNSIAEGEWAIEQLEPVEETIPKEEAKLARAVESDDIGYI